MTENKQPKKHNTQTQILHLEKKITDQWIRSSQIATLNQIKLLLNVSDIKPSHLLL